MEGLSSALMRRAHSFRKGFVSITPVSAEARPQGKVVDIF